MRGHPVGRRVGAVAIVAVTGVAGCTALFGIDEGALVGGADGSVEASADGQAPIDGADASMDGKPLGAPDGNGSDAPGAGDAVSATDGPSSEDAGDGSTCGAHCAVALALGAAHACALMGDGTVSCWGDDTYAQLGDNVYVADAGGPDPTTPKSPPNTVNGLSQATAVAAGAEHTCALAGGNAYCWGLDDDGQCGDGRAVVGAGATSHLVVGKPTEVPGVTGAVELRAHGNSTCVRDAAGAMTCWGANPYGGLGSPSPSAFQACTGVSSVGSPCTPSPQPCQSGTAFASFDVGYLHTCGLTTAGQVMCWGDDEVGELGVDLDGGSSAAPVTAPLPGTPTSIATGISHSCAIQLDGTLYCWGYGAEGQLGDGVDLSSSSPSKSSTPGGPTVTGLSAGYYNTVVVLSDGTVACAGSDKTDQCGITATDNCPNANFAGACVLAFKRVTGLTGMKSAASGFLATCAIGGAGVVSCWGDDAYGELGDGHNGVVDGGFFDPVLTPTVVPL